MSDELRLRLEGPSEGIDARAARDGLTLLLKLLRSLSAADDSQATGERGWNLSGLSIGSVDCAVRADLDGDEVASSILSNAWSGIESLSARAGIPHGWNDRTVGGVIDLAKLTRYRGVQDVFVQVGSVTPVAITETVRQNAEKSLSAARESLGSVRGEVVRYVNDSHKREVRLREEPSGELVTVKFPARLERAILQAMLEKQSVQARGMLQRNAMGQKLELQAESVSAVPLRPRRASVREMVGALGADWTEGLSTDEWLGWQRGR